MSAVPDIPLLLQQACAATVSAAVAGQLTIDEALALTTGEVLCNSAELSSLPLEQRCNLVRLHWSECVSWGLFTAAWQDSLAALISGRFGAKRIVEVCAGSGVLSYPMRQRGLDWMATDISPSTQRPWPGPATQRLSALDAVRELGPDLVFWAWWSRTRPAVVPLEEAGGASAAPAATPPEDYQVVAHCRELLRSHGLHGIFLQLTTRRVIPNCTSSNSTSNTSLIARG